MSLRFVFGASGAGKSTMASEFLKHGWQLLTDDVSAILNIEEKAIHIFGAGPVHHAGAEGYCEHASQ